ncbi:MAG: tetratricopeptide repeat protein [Acidobacteria bacterium]|nr:tetratricopeptide repeat protein [Acidobacteriota bacterium]
MAVGTAYRATGEYDRAVEELRRALDMSPGSNRVLFQLGVTYLAQGRLDDAIRELNVPHVLRRGTIRGSRLTLDMRTQRRALTHYARSVLTELEAHRRDQYVSWFGIALIHDALGEKEPALAALERAYEDHAVEFGQAHYPQFKAIASEPRYQAVMRQVGLQR